MAGRDPILYPAQSSPTDVGLRSTARIASYTSQFLRPQNVLTGGIEAKAGISIDLPQFTPGALILVFIDGVLTTANTSVISLSWPSDWVELVPITLPPVSTATQGNGAVGWHIWTGNEPATLDLTWDTTVVQTTMNSATIDIVEIVDWHGSQPPEAGLPTEQNSNTGTQPNPPPVTASWGAEPGNLFLAVAFRGNATKNITVWPTNYTTDQHDARADKTATYGGQSIASRVFFSATDDPGAFTVSGGGTSHVSVTIVVRGNIPNTDIPRGGASIEEEEGSFAPEDTAPDDWEFYGSPLDDATVVGSDDTICASSFDDFTACDADNDFELLVETATFENTSTPPDDVAEVTTVVATLIGEEAYIVADDEDWSPDWTTAPPDQVDDVPFAASIDEFAEIEADPLDFECFAGPLSFPNDETGETTGAASFDDPWVALVDESDEAFEFVFDAVDQVDDAPEISADSEIPLSDDDGEFEWFGSPSADAPVITDDTITATAFDEWFVDEAPADEWMQGPVDQVDAIPAGGASLDDPTDLDASADEWTSGPPDQNDDTPDDPVADDVDEIADAGDVEWTQGPPAQVDDVPARASVDEIEPVDETDAGECFAGPIADTPLETPAPAIDEAADLDVAGDFEHFAGPIADTPLETPPAAIDDLPVDEAADPGEWTQGPPHGAADDAAPFGGASLDETPADDLVDPGEWSAGPNDVAADDGSYSPPSLDQSAEWPDPGEEWFGTPPAGGEPNPAVDAVRVFDHVRARFGRRGRNTEFAADARRAQFSKERNTEFTAPARRRVFRSRLIVEGQDMTDILRNDLERIEKRTTENPSFEFNFAKFVKPNVIVARITGMDGGIALGVTSVQKGIVTSTNLIVTGAAFVGQKVAAFFDAGTALEDYDVFATALMSDGQRLTVAGIIQVRDPL